MRGSLTARYVAHPRIDFGSGRHASPRPRLGLRKGSIVYHGRRGPMHALPTVAALRAHTSDFRYPSLGPVARGGSRRVASLGLPRAPRA
ncbi:MAG: hypothetical protein DLM71_09945 [Chloroflexi bacterium]|nr:MAG: hypothetical protein DLM71_09945 [Chloroflexota bacterium]